MIVPIMPVDPVAPAIKRSEPPTYANTAAIFLDSIISNYSVEKINNLRAHKYCLSWQGAGVSGGT